MKGLLKYIEVIAKGSQALAVIGKHAAEVAQELQEIYPPQAEEVKELETTRKDEHE